MAFPSKSFVLAEYEMADDEPLSLPLSRIFLVVSIMACTFHFGPKRRGALSVETSQGNYRPPYQDWDQLSS